MRHTRKRKGGSYRTPMNPMDEFHLRVLNAHGTITPEYYYIVPENVYLLMPNTCGVRTTTSDVVSQSIFESPEEGAKQFRSRFVKGGMNTSKGAPFTVYEPGDIVPIHVFAFSPLLSGVHSFLRTTSAEFPFGFVGTFQPGSLEKLPFLNNAIADGDAKNNYFRLLWVDLIRQYDLVTRRYFYVPNNSYIIQNYCMTLLDYLRSFGDPYKEVLRPYAGLVNGDLTREQCRNIIKFLLPVIPENSMSKTILDTGKYEYSLYDVVDHLSSKDGTPVIILFNACRSLKEATRLESAWNDDDPKTTKPSMALVRAISESGHTNDSEGAVNMKAIRAFRAAKGLSMDTSIVLKYDQLAALLRETYASYNHESDVLFAPLMRKLLPLLDILGSYTPPSGEPVFATKYMDANMARIYGDIEESTRRAAETAAVAEKEGRERELTALKRRRDKLKIDRMTLKKGKRNTTELNVELATVTEQIRRLTA